MKSHDLDVRNTAPAQRAAAVVPSQTDNLTTGRTRGLWVGSEGNLDLMFDEADGFVLHTNVTPGYLPVAVVRVGSSRTTCTGVVAWY